MPPSRDRENSAAPASAHRRSAVALATVAAIGLWALVSAGAQWHVWTAPAALLFALRWLVVIVLIAWATLRRSLTTWILVAMVAGGVFGHDFPGVAKNLQ